MVEHTKTEAIKEKRLSPIIKWTGGKEQELKYIHPAMPKKIKNYYEPFVGGGAVYFSINANKIFINDKSHELISLYKAIKDQDNDFFSAIEEIMNSWKLLERIVITNKDTLLKIYYDFSENKISVKEIDNWLSSFILHSQEFYNTLNTFLNINLTLFEKEIKDNFKNKIKRISKIEKEKEKLSERDILNHIETSFKSAFYIYFRHLYNNIKAYNISHSFTVAIFFFIRNFSYGGMFRYNKNGDFNVPYGGIGYNRKNLSKKIEHFKSPELLKHLQSTTIDNLDFEDFFKKNRPKKDDFIFLDPPYDSKFNTYAKNQFTREDQIRLANYLIKDCEANWLMVIKNTDFIYSLYNKKDIYISSFDKKYLVNFRNRNDKNTEHLIIRNYKLS